MSEGRRWVKSVSVTIEFVINGTRVVLGATADVLEGDRPAEAYDAALSAIGDQAVDMYEKAAAGRRHPAGVVAAAASSPAASAPIPHPSVGQSGGAVRVVEGGTFSLSTNGGKTLVKWSGDRYQKFGLPVWPEVWDAAQVSDEDRLALKQQGVIKADGKYAVELADVGGKERVRRVVVLF